MINLPDSVKNEYKDFNREIKICGNLYLAQKRESYNLLKSVYETKESNGMTIKAQGNTYYISGEWNSQDGGPTFDCDFTLPAGTYTINLNRIGNSNYPYVSFKNGNTEMFAITGEQSPKTITLSSNTQITKVFFYFNSSEYNTKYQIMINQGSESKEFENYGEIINDYNVINTTSHNLFNYKTTNPGWINNSNVVQNSSTDIYCYTDYIKVTPNTNYILNLFDATGLNYGAILQYNSSKTFINNPIMETWKKITFKTSSETYYVRFTCRQDCQRDVQFELGQTATPYEKFNSSPFRLNDSNNSQILSFNINEKTDVYYTSVPYNKMTLEINNESGYFTDYDEDSILDYLNSDCYVDLFMKINNGDYYKIMTMNFDKVSTSDYERATLNFYGNIALLENYNITDKYGAFEHERMYFPSTTYSFDKYLLDNYNIYMKTNHETGSIINFFAFPFNNIKDIVIYASTHFGLNLSSVMLTNNYRNDIFLKAFTQTSSELLTSALQLEKTKVKKEDTYNNCIFNWADIPYTWKQTNDTYTKIFQKTLQSKRDVIIYTDNDYRMTDITSNDISVEGNVSVTLGENQGQIDRILIFIVEGNIGESYAIAINKSNIYKRDEKIISWNMKHTTDTSKSLTINSNKCAVANGICDFLFFKKPLKSYVECKIMGLPYLELGDTIKVELENRNVKFIITEIDTNFGNGLIQTIKGYELDWTYQAEAPYNDLNDWTDD